MYSVNVAHIPGYEIKVVKGTPIVTPLEGKENSFTYASPEFFEINILRNGELHGVLTPGGADDRSPAAIANDPDEMERLIARDRVRFGGIESLGNGKVRVHVPGVGYADLSAVYADTAQGWTVEVEQTNITDAAALEQIVREYRDKELSQ
jgi:hypothetical protein